MLPTNRNRFHNLALILVAVLLGYLTYKIMRPFILPIVWAIVLTIVFYPLYVLIRKVVKLKSVAVLCCIVAILVVLLGPFAYFSYVLTQEVMTLSAYFQTDSTNLVSSMFHNPLVNRIAHKVLAIFHMTEKDFTRTIVDNISEIGKQSMGIISTGLGNAVVTLANFIFMMLSVFFFLMEGPELVEQLNRFMPFSKRQRERLIDQTRDIVISTIYGGVTIAVIQGLMGGVAFSLLGISSPVMWGLATCISSFIPLVGTFIVWGPAVIYLAFQGFYGNAIILFIVGFAGISAVDSFLRPLLIRGRIKLPTLVIFFSILGGVKLFGFVGFIMGPLVFALFISVIEMLRYTEKDVFKMRQQAVSEE
ncbi:MAG: AI-2E family transporter [Syntrophobacterales bacterium]|jgi:predicted PurR-regulated permease PerM|nr:AI-2E family transporter [Syntrophobacterales bacterium]